MKFAAGYRCVGVAVETDIENTIPFRCVLMLYIVCLSNYLYISLQINSCALGMKYCR